MAMVMSGGPEKMSAQTLTQADVKALFKLMSEVVYAGQGTEDLAFPGSALALWFSAYGEHLTKLMDQWDELSHALQSEDAVRRARALHERLRKTTGHVPVLDAAGVPLRTIHDTQAHEVRSLILGKGMEI